MADSSFSVTQTQNQLRNSRKANVKKTRLRRPSLPLTAAPGINADEGGVSGCDRRFAPDRPAVGVEKYANSDSEANTMMRRGACAPQ